MIVGKSMSEKEYRKLDKLSASDLRLYVTDKKKFYREKVLKESSDDEDEYNRSFVIGDLVHTKLLEPDNFNKKFFMSQCTNPPTGLMLAFTEALYKYTKLATDENGVVTREFKDMAQDAYRDSGYKRDKFETVLEKFKGSNAEDYYIDLREAKTNGKQLVCLEDVNIADKIVQTLETHVNTRFIVNLKSGHGITVFHELQLEFTLNDLEMKSMLDKVVIDFVEKTIQIYDYKIVWDNTKFYKEYYLYRRADIQACIYFNGVKKSIELLSEKTGVDLSTFKILPPKFIVADSTNFYVPVIYTLTEEDVKNGLYGFEDFGRYYKGVNIIIKELQWHMEEGNWGDSLWTTGEVPLKHQF